MRRMCITNIVNELSRTAVFSVSCPLDVTRMYDLIEGYCKSNGTLANPRKNSYRLEEGALIINDSFIERVQAICPYRSRMIFDEQSYYIEGQLVRGFEC